MMIPWPKPPLQTTPFQKACSTIAAASPSGVIQTQATEERMRALTPMASPVHAVKVTCAKGDTIPRIMNVKTNSTESADLMKYRMFSAKAKPPATTQA